MAPLRSAQKDIHKALTLNIDTLSNHTAHVALENINKRISSLIVYISTL